MDLWEMQQNGDFSTKELNKTKKNVILKEIFKTLFAKYLF